jgi:biotin carboxyl carrier protein
MSRTLAIKSPKATKVHLLHVESGMSVQAGDVLLDLYDLEERKVLSTIDRSIEENASKLSELSGARVQQKLEWLNRITLLKNDAVLAAQVAYESTRLGLEVGVRTSLDVSIARQALALRTYQVLQSAVEAEIYSRNTQDAASVLAMMDKLLRAEKEYVERAVARLSIKAPCPGRFLCYVATGTPVRVGHLLGEIEQP